MAYLYFKNMTNTELVLARIQAIREDKKLSTKQMCQQLNVSESTYNRIESGKIKLTVEMLFRITEILQCNLYQVLNLEENKSFSENKENFFSNNHSLIVGLSNDELKQILTVF